MTLTPRRRRVGLAAFLAALAAVSTWAVRRARAAHAAAVVAEARRGKGRLRRATRTGPLIAKKPAKKTVRRTRGVADQ